MATRDLTVRLRADVEGYKRAMRDAAKATGDLERQGLATQRAGRAMSSFGAELTKSVTLPIVAVGAAATKMAMDFDATFAQMQGLAGVTADEVDGLKESVLGLAGETGRAPQELAEALYFIRSSGIEGQRALDALEVSAKAAASGLGSTEVVADAVTSAMNAYAESGMTAARATDVLVATAREGKAEPAELAAQMGRLLPVASELGISFEDVGAAIATLSLSGNDAATSATQLGNVMSKMLKPSQQGAAALEAVGLSVEDLETMIAERGLLGTLEELQAQLGDAGFVRFLEDQQAVQGGLGILGGDLDATRERFDALGDSAGASADAFDKTDSSARDMQKAWAEVQAAMIEVGSVIAPMAADLARIIASLAQAFGDLPGPVQSVVVGLLGIAAAAGPVLWVAGKLITAWGALMTGLSKFAVPAGTVSGAFDQAGTSADGFRGKVGRIPAAARLAAGALGALGVVIAGLEIFNTLRVDKVADELKSLTDGIDVAGLEGTREALAAYRAELDELDQREGKGRLFSVAGVNVFGTNGDADRQERIDQLRQNIEELEASEESLEGQERESAAAFAGASGAMSDLTDETTLGINAVQDYSDALRAQFDPLFGMLDALGANAEAQGQVTEAQNALNDAIATYGATSPEATEAQAALTEAQRQATGSALDVSSATASLNAAIAANPALLQSSKDQLAVWVAQGLISQSTADAMAAQFDQTAASAAALGATDPNVAVTAETATAMGLLDQVWGGLLNLDGQTATVTVTEVWNRVESKLFNRGGLAFAGGGVVYAATGMVAPDGPRGTDTIPAWLTPGEMVLNKGQQANLWNLLSSGSMVSASAGGGGVAQAPVIIDARGAIISSQAQFDRMVASALSRNGERGRQLTYRGRRL